MKDMVIRGTKKKVKRIMKKVLLGMLLLIIFMYVNNSSLFSKAIDQKPLLLAHRGLAQTFSIEGIENDTCTAKRFMNQNTHI
jgi:glycerophosphoryl diester phosphodiesterase